MQEYSTQEYSTIEINNTCEAALEFAIMQMQNGYRKLLVASYFSRNADSLSKMFVGCAGVSRSAQINVANFRTLYSAITTNDKYVSRVITRVINNEKICKALTYDVRVNNTLILTDADHWQEALYNALMWNYGVPIMKEWVEYIYKHTRIQQNAPRVYFFEGDSRKTSPGILEFMDKYGNSREIDLDTLRIYDLSDLTEEALRNCIERGLNRREIKIADEPQVMIAHSSMDEYMSNNADMLKGAVEEATRPLAPVNGRCEFVRLKHKRLLSQQGAMVNAACELLRTRKNVFFMEGMGVGKTLQALSTVLQHAVTNAMKWYPGKTLREIYEEGLYSSYTWVMCPGQLCEKWKREAESEIPHCTATVIHSLAEAKKAVDLENAHHGKDLLGIRLYIVSMDTAKLSYSREPSPNPVERVREPRQWVCRTCLNSPKHYVVKREMAYGRMQKHCPNCDGTDWVLQTIGKKRPGLTCPHCGELLLNNTPTPAQQENGNVELDMCSFSRNNNTNQYCTCCGEPLWGPDVKPVNTDDLSWAEQASKPTPEKKWVKVMHYRSYQRTDKISEFAPRGAEVEVLGRKLANGATFPTDWYETNEKIGTRRFPIADYVRRYSRKADFIILDEVHKYATESGQAHAAHKLLGAAKKSLCLTGTISNGKASSLFYLLWYTEPNFMREEGYTYNSLSQFISDYGTKEQTFTGAYSADAEYGTIVKKRSVSAPKEKAGLSPILHLKLLGKGIFLDLDDFASGSAGGQMPPLTEVTRFAALDDVIEEEYIAKLNTLKRCVMNPEMGGVKLLSKFYNFSLFFPDVPYLQRPVADPLGREKNVIEGANMDEKTLDSVLEDGLLNKERLIIEDLTDILNRGERAFIFCECTDKENIMPRYKRIVMKHCGLSDREVQVITSAVPIAKREEWMRKTSQKNDVKVFICNPSLTDTGIDFIFNGDDGKVYNFSNILFTQLGTKLAVQWQASRRSYRLNQTLPCYVYYYAYEGTAQATALELMGLKIASVSAAQGRFSSSALAAMTADVDPRVKLAEALMKGKVASADEINKIFDTARNVAAEVKCIYDGFEPAGSFYELLETTEDEYNATHAQAVTAETESFNFSTIGDLFSGSSTEPTPEPEKQDTSQLTLDDFLASMAEVAETAKTETTKESSLEEIFTAINAINTDNYNDFNLDAFTGFETKKKKASGKKKTANKKAVEEIITAATTNAFNAFGF